MGSTPEVRIGWSAGNGYGRRLNVDQTNRIRDPVYVHRDFQEAMAAAPSTGLRAMTYGLQSLEGEHLVGVGATVDKTQEIATLLRLGSCCYHGSDFPPRGNLWTCKLFRLCLC